MYADEHMHDESPLKRYMQRSTLARVPVNVSIIIIFMADDVQSPFFKLKLEHHSCVSLCCGVCETKRLMLFLCEYPSEWIFHWAKACKQYEACVGLYHPYKPNSIFFSFHTEFCILYVDCLVRSVFYMSKLSCLVWVKFWSWMKRRHIYSEMNYVFLKKK